MKNFILKIKDLFASSNNVSDLDAEQYITAAALAGLHLSNESLDMIACKSNTTREKLLSQIDKTYYYVYKDSFPAIMQGVDSSILLNRYFSGNPHLAEEKLAELVSRNLLTENDMILFESSVTNSKLLKTEPVLNSGISRINIFNLVRNCGNFESAFRNRDKLYKLEASKLYTDYFFNKDSIESEECLYEIRKSYVYACESFTEKTAKSRRIKAWCKYVNACADFNIERLPEELLEITGFYKEASDFFKYRLNLQNQSDKFYNYAIQISEKILHEINEDDMPSLLMLGKAYRANGDFERAKNSLLKASSKLKFNGMTSLLELYESEICKNLDGTPDWKLIYTLNCEVEELYNTFLDALRKNIEQADESGDSEKLKEDYIVLVSRYGRFKRNRRHYDTCFDVLETAAEQYKDHREIYRVYNELGFLYQTPGKQNFPNPYHDNEKAIEMFKAADSAVRETREYTKNPGVRKYILMPLANTYFSNQKYEEALDVCDEVLSIDRNEKRAKNLRDRIMVSMAA